MTTIISIIISVIICVFLIVISIRKDSQIKIISSKLTESQIENARLKERVSNSEDFNKSIREEASSQFKTLANEIFSSHSENLKKTNEERIVELLNPLKEEIKDFKTKVDDTYIKSTQERSVLGEQMKKLMELNASIGKEARDLTEALSGNSKIQGEWGELVLQTILDKSGLVEGENYFVQQTKNENGEQITGADGRLRPDVIVKLPDQKSIVIDSKVSLNAYVKYINADNETDRKSFGQAHILSVRNHLKELATKRYQDYIGNEEGRIDYVLMFIPNEHAYMTAMSLDKDLWMEAYDKRIVIISPAHVISTLRLIAQLWTRDKQTRNAILIAEESGKLYDKFVGFVNDLNDIGQNLDKAKAAYSEACSKLKEGRGNLISKTQRLKDLGAKAKKTLPSEVVNKQVE